MSYSKNGPQITPPPATPTPTPTPNGNIIVRARGIKGGENLEVRVKGIAIATFTLTTEYRDYYASGNGQIELHFTNDDGVGNGKYAQVDYMIYNGVTYQAEEQEINTAVWQNDSCGGSYSEMMNCNGYIRFTTTGPAADPVTPGGCDSGTAPGGCGGNK